jgi:hypothetical protein
MKTNFDTTFVRYKERSALKFIFSIPFICFGADYLVFDFDLAEKYLTFFALINSSQNVFFQSRFREKLGWQGG